MVMEDDGNGRWKDQEVPKMIKEGMGSWNKKQKEAN